LYAHANAGPQPQQRLEEEERRETRKKEEGKDQHCRSKYNARERKETEFVGVRCVCVVCVHP